VDLTILNIWFAVLKHTKEEGAYFSKKQIFKKKRDRDGMLVKERDGVARQDNLGSIHLKKGEEQECLC